MDRRQEFKNLAQAIKSGNIKTTGDIPNYVKSPQLSDIDEAGVKRVFGKDFNYWYSKIKSRIEYFDKIPVNSQLAILHTAFAGKLSGIDTNTQDVSKLIESVAKIRDKRGTAQAERDTIRIAKDEILDVNKKFQSSGNNHQKVMTKIEPQRVCLSDTLKILKTRDM